MKLSLVRRSLIFATFFGSCACVALLAAALATPHWLEASARRLQPPHEPWGHINFGLFEGRKELNMGYGVRTYYLSVRQGNLPARRWAWCGAAALTAAAAAASLAAALLAALSAAAAQRCRPRPLLLCNCATVVLSVGAVGVWTAEYWARLQHEVVGAEEAGAWSSAGGARLGASLWLAAGGALAAALNAALVALAMAERAPPAAPALHHKHNPTIMLY